MIPFPYLLLSLLFLTISPKSVHSSVQFIMNPGCTELKCISPGNPAIFYANEFIGDNTIHMFYSSLDELTISIVETKKGYGPQINYTSLFQRNYSSAITFGITPSNSFSLIIRRLMKFTDKSDTGRLNESDTPIQSYPLKNLTTNFTRYQTDIVQPSFVLPLADINGLLTIDIIYPGESTRDTKFPKLCSTPKSFYLNIALQANNIPYAPTRFAFEFYIVQLGVEGTQLGSTKYIDDQYTPGVFNVWQLKSRSPFYTSSMLWKPIVYQSAERSTEQTTLMEIYDLKNNLSLSQSDDQGIFQALYKVPYVSGFNVSLGHSKDKFFVNTNYSFIQFTAGLDSLEIDSVKQFVVLALLIALALPTLVSLITLVFIIKRRCSRPQTSSYDEIDD